MTGSGIAVIGLDLSLTGTGLAYWGTSRGWGTDIVKSRGRKGASLLERQQRLAELADMITLCVPDDALVVIEQPAYAQVHGSPHDRSGLWWLVVSTLILNGNRVVEVPPSTAKKYATGKGNANKDEMIAALVKRYPTAEITDNNVADAVNLAAMGARYQGHDIDTVPARNLEAMAAVRWES
ncbi:hypothetical protein [Mycetocola saprophilus]|uniref:hypothetical protein n=1 Tax=Mycetocola saprophilus TaxID=76636 RepID=UPI003BEF8632